MIFTKNERTNGDKREFEVRTLGHTFWISETEFRKELENGHLFFKANKLVHSWA